MSLDQAIKHNKEFRQDYYKSKRFDTSCRNHGSCGYCRDNRLYRFKKAEPIIFDEEYDWEIIEIDYDDIEDNLDES